MQETPTTQQAPAKAPAPKPVQRKAGPVGGATSTSAAARSQSSSLVQFALSEALQLAAATGMARGNVHDVAAQGISGPGTTVPHLDTIQMSFGRHDISTVQSHTDSAATSASAELGAHGYASGNHVAFADASPSLHTTAHEVAHVVQQRAGVQLKGAVGQVGDKYERHADAVADKVVKGESAEALLDEMAPQGDSGAPAVQAKVVQFDIKSDLRDAMSGWGTDEDAIYDRLRRASPEELQTVVGDSGLMSELRDELTYSEMRRVLDLLQAPLPMKLRLAMDGWGADETYVHSALANASPEELAAVAADQTMVNRLKSELSSEDTKAVFDRIGLSLKGKIEYAMEGWGVDETYIFTSIASAPIDQITAITSDTATLAKMQVELGADSLPKIKGALARRAWELGDGGAAFSAIDDTAVAVRTARLTQMGPIETQRAMLDNVIANETNAARFGRAFQSYWNVELGAVDGATMAQWPMPVLRTMHAQLKVLPDQDTRAGFWTRLTLSDASTLDSQGNEVGLKTRAAWGGGNFIVGTQASNTSTQSAGYGTKLTAAAAVNDTKITVEEGDRLQQNDVIKVGTGANAEGGLKITGISGGEWTLDKKLTKAHAANTTRVVPDDGSAERDINWLEATVRHEIAHGIDENMASTVKGFTEGIGGWWTGTSYDDWIAQMSDPYKTTAATPLTAAEKGQIKAAIVDATTNQKGSLYSLGLAATHPIVKYAANNIPVIRAAEACLSREDQFYNSPTALFRDNSKGFAISFWYKRFMYFNESIISQRVANYGLYAPTEFFAEAYTVFYEEAGKPGITDADYGRLLRNTTWRDWIRTNIHERGQAPAGTGASGDATGATPGSSSRGKDGGDPGP